MLIFESYVKLKNRAFCIFYGMRGFTTGLGRGCHIGGGVGLRIWTRDVLRLLRISSKRSRKRSKRRKAVSRLGLQDHMSCAAVDLNAFAQLSQINRKTMPNNPISQNNDFAKLKAPIHKISKQKIILKMKKEPLTKYHM